MVCFSSYSWAWVRHEVLPVSHGGARMCWNPGILSRIEDATNRRPHPGNPVAGASGLVLIHSSQVCQIGNSDQEWICRSQNLRQETREAPGPRSKWIGSNNRTSHRIATAHGFPISAPQNMLDPVAAGFVTLRWAPSSLVLPPLTELSYGLAWRAVSPTIAWPTAAIRWSGFRRCEPLARSPSPSPPPDPPETLRARLQ